MAVKTGNIKVRNTTEGVIDLGVFYKEHNDKGQGVGEGFRVIIGSCLDENRKSEPDRPVYSPKQEFPVWAWDAAMKWKANQEHLTRGRLALGW